MPNSAGVKFFGLDQTEEGIFNKIKSETIPPRENIFLHRYKLNAMIAKILLIYHLLETKFRAGEVNLQLIYQSMKLKIFIVLIAGLHLQACASEPVNTAKNANNQNANSNTVKTAPANVNAGNANGGDTTLMLNDISKTATIPCNGREVEIEEPTTTSNYTFTGECKKLIVDGVSNQVTVEKVGEIVVMGVSNKVFYGEGLDGKKPKITKNGVSVIVQSQAEKEKADARQK